MVTDKAGNTAPNPYRAYSCFSKVPKNIDLFSGLFFDILVEIVDENKSETYDD